MALNNYDLILDIMYPTQEQTNVTRKMVTSNKYKESHSTYWKLQLLKYMYSWFLQNYEKLNDYTFDEPTEKDLQRVYTIYKQVKENIFYIGHNVGSLGNDIDDSLKSYGQASH